MLECELCAFGGELCAVKLRLIGAPPTAPTGGPTPGVFVAGAPLPPEEGGVELPGLAGGDAGAGAGLFEVGVGVPVTVGAGVAGTLVPPLQAASSAAVAPANKSFWKMFKKSAPRVQFRPAGTLNCPAEGAVREIARGTGHLGAT